MEEFRQQIDTVDENIVDLLSQRFAVVRNLADFKSREGLEAEDRQRFNQLVARLSALGYKKQLPSGLIEEVYDIIHRYSITAQRRVK